MLELRELTPEEFPLLVQYGQQFFDEYKDFVDDAPFDGEHFLESLAYLHLWSQLTVFGLWAEGGSLVGGLAVYTQDSVFNTTKVGREMFLYVHPKYRGGTTLIRLLKAYRTWGQGLGLRYCYMIHLHMGPLEEKLGRVYELCGYRKLETAYRLDLKD